MFDKKARVNLNPAKFAIFFLLSLIAIYLVTWGLNSLFSEVAIIDVGIPLLFLTVLLAGIPVYLMFVQDGKFNQKDWLGMGLYLLILFFIVLYLPTWFPSWFAGDVTISKLIGSIDLFKSVVGLP